MKGPCNGFVFLTTLVIWSLRMRRANRFPGARNHASLFQALMPAVLCWRAIAGLFVNWDLFFIRWRARCLLLLLGSLNWAKIFQPSPSMVCVIFLTLIGSVWPRSRQKVGFLRVCFFPMDDYPNIYGDWSQATVRWLQFSFPRPLPCRWAFRSFVWKVGAFGSSASRHPRLSVFLRALHSRHLSACSSR